MTSFDVVVRATGTYDVPVVRPRPGRLVVGRDERLHGVGSGPGGLGRDQELRAGSAVRVHGDPDDDLHVVAGVDETGAVGAGLDRRRDVLVGGPVPRVDRLDRARVTGSRHLEGRGLEAVVLDPDVEVLDRAPLDRQLAGLARARLVVDAV